MSNIPRDRNGVPYYTEDLSPSDYVWKMLGVDEVTPFKSDDAATIFDVVTAANSMQRRVRTGEPMRIGDSSLAFGFDLTRSLQNSLKLHIPICTLVEDANGRKFSKEKLRDNMSKCSILDDIYALEGGCGPSTIRLNATTYSQPRRISWSVRLNARSDENLLFAYSQAYRVMTDWNSREMPKAIFLLGVALWNAARSRNCLSEISQCCPPTACQLLIYHTLFDGSIGRHRDNGLIVDGKGCRTAHSEKENSQIRGSSVLTYTIFGHAGMEFELSKPPSGKTQFNTNAAEYKPFQVVKLETGDLLVWNPHDDEKFMHKAWFDPMVKRKGSEARYVFTFRWLASKHLFTSDDHSLIKQE